MKLASIFFILLHTLLAWGEQDNEKREGTINDLFSEELEAYYSEEYVELKDTIEYDQENLISLFKKVEKKLDKQLEIISERGSEIIPTVSYDKIRNNGGKLPEGVADKVRKRGVLIVRNVIPKEEIEDMMTDLHKYLYKNGMYPPKNKDQSVYETYWSQSQMKARQHPNMYAVQKAMLSLWHTNENNAVDVDLTKPAMYIDRLRMRPPGDSKFTLPPHVDGGGVERWKDRAYRTVYRHLLEGDLEAYDPFEVDYRVAANMNDFGYENGCTFFRAFQGWLSMGNTGPGKGTLRVVPLLKESTAYWYLRPFLSDVPRDFFPGTSPGKTFHILSKWHPKLHDALVTMPDMGPGDTVWWHADLIHSVEKEHLGSEYSSVFYIPSGPDCAINRDYLRRMRHTFMLGQSPPDFPVNNYEEKFEDRATLKHVSEIGREMMGFDPQLKIVDQKEESCQGKP